MSEEIKFIESFIYSLYWLPTFVSSTAVALLLLLLLVDNKMFKIVSPEEECTPVKGHVLHPCTALDVSYARNDQQTVCLSAVCFFGGETKVCCNSYNIIVRQEITVRLGGSIKIREIERKLLQSGILGAARKYK